MSKQELKISDDELLRKIRAIIYNNIRIDAFYGSPAVTISSEVETAKAIIDFMKEQL